MKRRYYMHLIDNRPGYFWGGQVCFAGSKISTKNMVKDLKTIRKQQELSKKYRVDKDFGDLGRYDYMIVTVEEL